MKPRPAWRMVGGKTQLLPQLHEALPPDWRARRYLEPMVGGGALYWSLLSELEQPAEIGDAQPAVARTYRAIRDQVEDLVAALEAEEVAERRFLHHRAVLTGVLLGERSRTDVEVATSFLYHQACGFNGLFRVSSRREVNSPWGSPKPGKDIVRADLLLACSEAMQENGTQVRAEDWSASVFDAGEGDLVYADPAYWPGLDPKCGRELFGHRLKGSFTAYTSGGWSNRDSIALVEALTDAADRGAFIILSNAWNPGWVERLRVAGWSVREVHARRSVNSDGAGRGLVGELIATRGD